MLLDEGVDVRAVRGDGTDALMFAVSRGQTQCARLLLDRGANVHARTRDGETALFKAVRLAHVECTKLLLDGGSDPNICNKLGETPLMIANDSVCTKLLLEFGADLRVHPRGSPTLLSMAILENEPDKLVVLLHAGAAVDEIDERHQHTALWLAIRTGRTKCASHLLHAGADPNRLGGRKNAKEVARKHGQAHMLSMLRAHDESRRVLAFDKKRHATRGIN